MVVTERIQPRVFVTHLDMICMGIQGVHVTYSVKFDWLLFMNFTILFFKYYLQHERPCCIRYLYSIFVYLIQHGRECCK